jgi:uncharacterized protein (UPF0332 family)
MDGRAVLGVADELAAGTTEAHWRAAAGRAYYALFHEARAALESWGFAPPHREAHRFVREHFTYPAEADLKQIGSALQKLGQWRNQADYQLAP